MPFDGSIIDNDPVIALLRTGRKRIERGWGRTFFRHFSLIKFRMVYCAVGAIRSYYPFAFWLAKRMNEIESDAYQFLVKACYRDIITWNDDYRREKEDVLRLYDKAINIAENTILIYKGNAS